MKCPHCKSDMRKDSRVNQGISYAKSSLNIVRVSTECCQKFILVRPVVSFDITPSKGNLDEDDLTLAAKSVK